MTMKKEVITNERLIDPDLQDVTPTSTVVAAGIGLVCVCVGIAGAIFGGMILALDWLL